MPSRSRSHLATKTCSIKKVSLSMQTGQTELPAHELADLPCTPLMSMDENTVTAIREQLLGSANTGRKQVFVFADRPIVRGDLLIHEDMPGKELPISNVNKWGVSEPFMVLIVDEIQANQEPTEIFTR